MGFLDGLFKKPANEIAITAPLSGASIPLSEVSDPAFNGEVLGKGIAITPADGKVYAPADGVITTMFPTGHAVGMTTDDGVELLIHVGMDTVELKGAHFTTHVADEQKVKKGDLLIEADLDKIKEAGYAIITPVVVCNTADYADVEGITGQEVSADSVIIKVKKA